MSDKHPLLSACSGHYVRLAALLAVMSLAILPAMSAEDDSGPEYITVDRVPLHLIGKYNGITFLKESYLDSTLNYVDTEMVPIIFKRNKTYLRLPNPPLDSVVALVNKVLSDPELRLAYVWIGGSASPEGPEKHNEWLGKTRAKRLYDYLKSHTPLPDSLIRVDNLMEDWRTPLLLIEKDDFANKQKVIDIWNTENDNERRKRKIMAIDRSVTWEYLIDKPFRPARNARMVIVCVAKDRQMKLSAQNIAPDIAPPLPPHIDIDVVYPEYRGQFVALKTNIGALAGFQAANIGGEFSFGHGFSFDLPFYYSPYDITPTYRVRVFGIQPELRYWLNRDWPGDGHFLGINSTVAGFDISYPGHNRFQDPEHALWGVGVSYGYAFNFGKSKRWGIELNLGMGYMNYRYDTFRNEHNGKLIGTSPTKHYRGISRVGINLTYKWWRKKRVGNKQ